MLTLLLVDTVRRLSVFNTFLVTLLAFCLLVGLLYEALCNSIATHVNSHVADAKSYHHDVGSPPVVLNTVATSNLPI